MNSAPEISGYELDQRLLDHPLAEIWRGRSFTGMEVVVLVLSAAGADDPAVRDRLSQASRTAALEPERQELPLWAANLTATRPYAVTQLVPGQSGAERLLDPLDGLLGNDEQSLAAVREQLTPYGAAPIPGGEREPHAASAAPASPAGPPGSAGLPGSAGPPGSAGAAGPGGPAQATRTSKKWPYLVAVVVVLAVFSITYSIGAAIKSATSEVDPAVPPPAAVSPAALPTGVLSPGIDKVTSVPWSRSGPFAPVVGAIYPPGADLQVARQLDLPFEFGFPEPPVLDEKQATESSTTIYRRVLTGTNPAKAGIDLRIALRPCTDQAACLAGRAAFDKEWSTTYKTSAPTTRRDSATWYAVTNKPYTLVMSHVFSSQGRWWLVGTAAVAAPGEEPGAQKVVNDIWRQTS
ncbi:hypothetical protein [Kribbella italica]|uniref:Uncharacterized protein n=1 Tax=Kribbella italica TaxID=1540520 RepID=A0A7W9JD94_9ACTN|nr:hypothetical protein [Kribbella italica]MBB5839560.1 hypothetical protein [Kribbella italica]